ncbi:hypothetical protein COLO4_18707 [Corchorus olitorius]|uniref:Uncharacterized protein n=1 Tax=Corchorus olitorius TaxID=93759 RepID=A0A1R3J873_9ROSI|nr:hypothetical protein COLO4_18707 [Corchorus olitorius]
MADYVFYRTFDVQQCIISDKIDDQIAGIDAKFIFNRVGSLEPNSVHTPGVDNKHASENAKETTERMTLRTSSSENRHPEDYKQEEVADGVAEKLPANDRQDNATFNKTASSLKVEEKSDLKVPSVNPVVSPREKPVSGAGIESGQPTKTDDRQGSTSCENIGLSHNIIDEKMDRVGNSFVSQVKVEEKLKFTEDLGESNERPHKKAKVDSSVSVSDDKNKIHVLKPNRDSDANTSKPIVPNFTASEDKSRHAIDPLGTAKESSKKLNVDEDVAKPTGGKSQKKTSCVES